MQPVVTLNRPKLIDCRPTVLTARAKSTIKKRDVRDTVTDWWNGLSDNAKMLTGVAVLFVIYLVFAGGRGYVSNAKSVTCFVANDAGFLLTSGSSSDCANQGNWRYDKFGTQTQISQGDQCISALRVFDYIPIIGRIPGRSLPLQTTKCDQSAKDQYQLWKTLNDRTESVAYPGYCLTSGFPVSTAVTLSACGNSGKIVMK